MIRVLKDITRRSQRLFERLRYVSHRALPLVGVLIVVSMLSLTIPVGDTLWSKVLGIRGSVQTGHLPPTSTRPWQGCRLGFWRHEHHFSFWPGGLRPGTYFESIFGQALKLSGDPTLLEALELEGEGLDELMRQAVAAFLNAQHGDIHYRYSGREVVIKLLDAYATGEYESTLDLFKAANEAGCPLEGRVPVQTPTDTATPTNTSTATSTPTELTDDTLTPTSTPTDNPTATEAATATETPEATFTPTSTPTTTPQATDTPSPIPTQEGEGCGTSFWGGSENVDSWPEAYDPESTFESVFERDIPDVDPTFIQALELEGEGLDALMRQAVAALLNAESPDVEYVYDPEEIIEMFQAAFDSEDTEQIEATKDLFQAANEADCPLPLPTSTDTPTATETTIPSATPTSTDTPVPTDAPSA